MQLRSEGSLEPLNAASLPPGGLRQDHHGYESMPVSPAEARPYSAVLVPNNSTASLTNATGLVSLLVAPDNSTIVSPSSQLHPWRLLAAPERMPTCSGSVLVRNISPPAGSYATLPCLCLHVAAASLGV